MATQAMAISGMRQRVVDRSLQPEEWNAPLYSMQQRARRGPTPEVFCAKHIDNSRLVSEADPQRVREIRNFAMTMTVLFLLVMVYVVQHFQSIEYGYRIESQKQQLDELSEQNRQLGLTQAELNAPLRLDSMARNLGMDAPSPAQLVRENAAPGQSAPVLAKATMPAAPIAAR